MAKSIVSDYGYSGLNPMQFGYQSCPPNHACGPAIRTHWLLHYVVYGFGIFRIDSREYKVSPGEIFVIPPYVETYYEADSTNPWSYIWIGFTSDSDLPCPLPHILTLPEAGKIFNAMKSCEDYSLGKSAYLSSRLWDLFALVLGKKATGNDYVQSALDCIHSEYMKGITIEEIAARLNIDRTYLYNVFRKKVGMSPQKYLINHRMTVAAFLIKNRNVSVSTACYSAGYKDVFTFSKMFKKHFGVSPGKYSREL